MSEVSMEFMRFFSDYRLSYLNFLILMINLATIIYFHLKSRERHCPNKKTLDIARNYSISSTSSISELQNLKKQRKPKNSSKNQSNSKAVAIPGIKNKKLIDKNIRYEFIPVY